ncbi:MAG: ubiquitin-like domain-containing protein [Caulobacteraceae bacterium]
MKINLKNFKSLFSVKLVAVAAICLIFATSFAYSAMKKDITIEDIDGVKSISTFKNTVGDVLEENKIVVEAHDKINVDMADKLKDGLSIKISRAKRVTIKADGKSTTIFTVLPDVKGALKDAQIQVGAKDRVEPGLDAALKENAEIKVVRIEEKLVTQNVKMEFSNEIKKNDKLDKGLVHELKKGQPGMKELSIKVVYEDGKEAGREIVGEKVLKQPVNGVIEEGTRTTLVSSRGQVTRFVRAIRMVATAYDATYESTGKKPGHPQYGITYTGLRVKPGIVAVDPKVIPLGTWLYIEGYGEALAADIGGAIKGNRIDLYYESPRDVSRYGKRAVNVYILDKPRYKF